MRKQAPMRDKESGTPRARDILTCVLAVQVVFALTAGAALILDPAEIITSPTLQMLAGSLILMPIAAACFLALRFRRHHRSERIRARSAAHLMDTVLHTSREWVWAVDDHGIFTFSNQTSAGVLGYLPSELVGRHCSLILDVDELAGARVGVRASPDTENTSWTGFIARCQHRDGSSVWMESAGTSRFAKGGQRGGVEGTSRPLPPETAHEAASSHSRNKIQAMIEGDLLLTAFQPIYDLASRRLIGIEALSRFVSDDGAGAEYWFNEAAAVGLSAELELAALDIALKAAQGMPSDIYVALNISPATCLDPRLPGLLQRPCLPLDRIILELTERLEVSAYGPLLSALAPLRVRGLRIAVDDAGSGFASMRHILHIRPDIIKLDRSLISGIDDDIGQRALGAALVEFARQIGAALVAEGIETQEELAAVTGIGMSAGQGYLLGRPSAHPREWAAWRPAESSDSNPAAH